MGAANLRGALLVVLSMACFCINDAFIKELSTRTPIGQLIAVRGVFAVALMSRLGYLALGFPQEDPSPHDQ